MAENSPRSEIDEILKPFRAAAEQIGWPATVAVIVVLALIAVGIVVGPSGSGSSAAGQAAASPKSALQSTIEDAGAEYAPGGRCPSAAGTWCRARIKYTPSGIGSDREDADGEAIRVLGALAQARPDARGIEVTQIADLKSVGGKASRGAAYRASCTAAANRQIDWTGIEPAGLRKLCVVDELVTFED